MFAVGTAHVLLSVMLAGDAAIAVEPVGKPIESFTLTDSQGAKHSLDDWKDKRAIVVVFLGTECPLVARYGTKLAQLSEKYRDSKTQFVAIDSNQQDSLAEIAKFVRDHKLKFPVLKDVAGHVADLFGAQRTPETFVLDATRVVRYSGKIDDQFGVGYARNEASKEYLVEALDAVLADGVVGTPHVESVGCKIGRASKREPHGDVTYSKQVSRIFQERCVVCHREGEVAPFSLTSFQNAADWSETIREVVDEGRMPPWHANPNHGKFLNDARITDEEKRVVFEWIDNGMPEGDRSELPPPRDFGKGWRIPQPDLIVKMPQPHVIPASGVVEYQYFTVDPGFKHDVWIQKSEARPGNRSVVHHMFLFYIPPGKKKPQSTDALFNTIASYAPGLPAMELRDGLARRVPAGSKLVFQMHYTPIGTEQTDQSEAGLVFADASSVKRELTVGGVLNFQFLIPPGADNYRVEGGTKFTQDTVLYSFVPHMHTRGKSFSFTAVFPDGRSEILLDVPKYDFNWQNIYRLAEPKVLPAGSELKCVALYDNSAKNPANPNPKQFVHWGEQTWDEMMVGSFGYGPAEQDLSIGPPQVRQLADGKYEALFRYRPSADVKSVYLAGSFNDWKPDVLKLTGPDKEGWHTTSLHLEAGRYEYKFVLDGKTWKSDPGNREQTGAKRNSLLVIGK